MSKNRTPLQTRCIPLLAPIVLVGGIFLGGCRSAPCWAGHEELADSPGSEPYWCDWEYPEGRGEGRFWKTGSSKDGTIYVGEGIATTKKEAQRKAEVDMRAQAARGMKTDIHDVAVVRRKTDGTEERVQFQGETTQSTDVTVSIPPDGVYYELRQRKGYHMGIPLEIRHWRVLVKALVR